jgi:hypothetical protein
MAMGSALPLIIKVVAYHRIRLLSFWYLMMMPSLKPSKVTKLLFFGAISELVEIPLIFENRLL